MEADGSQRFLHHPNDTARIALPQVRQIRWKFPRDYRDPYLADLGDPLNPHEPLWWTLRRRDHGNGLRRQPLNYDALRAVFRRVNELLGTNWTMHDLRHTASLRMARDENLSLKDVQVILGHAHLSTTAAVYMVEDEARVIRRVRQHLDEREARTQQPPIPVATGYDATDLEILLGGSPS